MRRQFLTGLRMTACFIVLLGLIYPAVVYGVGKLAFSDRADGSFVKDSKGLVIGSSLIGQNFVVSNGKPDSRYFQPRPSMAGEAGYDAMSSAASNLGPSNQDLLDEVKSRAVAYRRLNGLSRKAAVPVDAVTASASGLDPHISIANADLQVNRVAKARGLSVSDVQALVAKHTESRQWGFLGEKVVNVLELNLDLDRQG
jgi:K+-transporting ATPase ATPase C chain